MNLCKSIPYSILFICFWILFSTNVGANNKHSAIRIDTTTKIDSLLHVLNSTPQIHKSRMCQINSKIASEYLMFNDVKSCEKHLSLAKKHIDSADDLSTIGYYYFVLGNLHAIKGAEAESHKFYYKSIYSYERTKENNANKIIQISNNIAFAYIQKRDTQNLKILLSRLKPIIEKCDDRASLAIYYRILSYYYRGLEYKTEDGIYLDSCIIYGTKVIDLYQNREKEDKFYAHEIAYTYIDLANNYLLRDDYDVNLIDSLSRVGISLADPKDTILLLNYLGLKANLLYDIGKKSDAKEIYKTQLAILAKRDTLLNLTMYGDLHGLIAEIYASEKQFEKAYDYEHKRYNLSQEILNSSKYQIISELQTQYETEKKEAEIARQKEVILAILFFSIVIIFSLTFFMLWMKRGRKIDRKQQQIIDLEKAETKLLIEKSETKNIIKQELINLVTTIENQILEKLNSYAKEQKWYLEKLTLIEIDSVLVLKNKGLTNTEVQYSISIALGMKKKHIMLCYNVEDQTVRLNRSVIKEKLGLEKDDNLDIYLIDLLVLKQK